MLNELQVFGIGDDGKGGLAVMGQNLMYILQGALRVRYTPMAPKAKITPMTAMVIFIVLPFR